VGINTTGSSTVVVIEVRSRGSRRIGIQKV